MWRKSPCDANKQATWWYRSSHSSLFSVFVEFLFLIVERKKEKWIKYSTRLDPIGSIRKPARSLIPSVMKSMYLSPLFNYFLYSSSQKIYFQLFLDNWTLWKLNHAVILNWIEYCKKVFFSCKISQFFPNCSYVCW